jgi:hypothetical protein
MKGNHDVSEDRGVSSCEANATDPFPVLGGASDVLWDWHLRGSSVAGPVFGEARMVAWVQQLLSFVSVLNLWADDHPVAWTEPDGSRVVRFSERSPQGRMDGKAVFARAGGEIVIDMSIAVDAGHSRAVDVAETRRFTNVRDAATFVVGRHIVHRVLTQQ